MARPFGPGLSSWDAPRAHGGKGHEDELTIAHGSLAHWDIQNLPYARSPAGCCRLETVTDWFYPQESDLRK